jgi:hypothetical protein
MHVRPAPGLKVRHPVTKELFGEADVIEISPGDLFWAKLLEHGDVVCVEPVDLKSED